MKRTIVATFALFAGCLIVSAPAGGSTGTGLRFASFNLQSVSLDGTSAVAAPWRKRRVRVISQILGEHTDVIGVQEANMSKHWAPRLVDGINQLLDLRNGLNKAGGSYAAVTTAPFNCVNASTTYHCVYQNRYASGTNRILYNTKTVSLVSRGALRYTAQDSTRANPAYLAYAILKVKATGSEFFFSDTHLEPGKQAIRVKQWNQLIAKTPEFAGSLPVISVGDFNTQKFDPLSATYLPAMKTAGFGDTLNQEYATNPVVDPRAQSTVNGWINSLNHLRRNVASFGYENARNKTGNNIDYIFATNSLVVKQWKVVVHYNTKTLDVIGVLPSDHNLVRATITIP